MAPTLDPKFFLTSLLEASLQAASWLISAWYVWAFVLFVVTLRVGPQLIEVWRLKKAGMPEIDRMTGLEFEKYLEILFTRLGYRVERTRYVGDQGGDLIAVKGGERILVQAKRHSKDIGNKAVQEAAAARPHYQCHRAMVVANREFTSAARALAKSNQVELWGRRQLAAVVLSTQLAPMAQASTPTKAPTCQRCGRPMQLRDGARGKFWGCSGFPTCRNSASL